MLICFYKAGAAYERRNLTLAESLASRAMTWAAGDFLHPYILNYELLLSAGKLEQAEAQQHQIGQLLDVHQTMNAETKNYIRFTLLRLTPDALLLGYFPRQVTDPVDSLPRVSKTYRLWWPYQSPRLTVQRLLATEGSTGPASARSLSWPA